eukprot:TRINITY_DN3460_c0_g1_i3.p1 TRINITY_DN3460_c0_g1~~TRINITY_DN3460_c0_g1_i3.p1  ORF type:complete len:558 (+),score=159.65 TRINITY_DN3460_c0_g1_i3:86-1675(+)
MPAASGYTVMAVAEGLHQPVRKDEALGDGFELMLFWIFSQFDTVVRIAHKFRDGKPHIYVQFQTQHGAKHALRLNVGHIPLQPFQGPRCVLAVTMSTISGNLRGGKSFPEKNWSIQSDPRGALEQARAATGMPLEFVWGQGVLGPSLLIGCSVMGQGGALPPLTQEVPGCVAYITGLPCTAEARTLGYLGLLFGPVVAARKRDKNEQHAYLQWKDPASRSRALDGQAFQRALRELYGCCSVVVQASDNVNATSWMGTTRRADGCRAMDEAGLCPSDTLLLRMPAEASQAALLSVLSSLGARAHQLACGGPGLVSCYAAFAGVRHALHAAAVLSLNPCPQLTVQFAAPLPAPCPPPAAACGACPPGAPVLPAPSAPPTPPQVHLGAPPRAGCATPPLGGRCATPPLGGGCATPPLGAAAASEPVSRRLSVHTHHSENPSLRVEVPVQEVIPLPSPAAGPLASPAAGPLASPKAAGRHCVSEGGAETGRAAGDVPRFASAPAYCDSPESEAGSDCHFGESGIRRWVQTSAF